MRVMSLYATSEWRDSIGLKCGQRTERALIDPPLPSTTTSTHHPRTCLSTPSTYVPLIAQATRDTHQDCARIQVTGIAEATTEQHLTDFFTYVVSHLHNQIHLSLRALLPQVLRQDHLRPVRPLGAYSHPQLREAFRRQDRPHAQWWHPRRRTPHHHQRHRAPGQGRQCPRRSHRPDRQAPRRQ